MSSGTGLMAGAPYDLIVVGLGAMGSAALLSGAEAGLRVSNLDLAPFTRDRFSPS